MEGVWRGGLGSVYRRGHRSADGVLYMGDPDILATLFLTAQLKYQCSHMADKLLFPHTAYNLGHWLVQSFLEAGDWHEDGAEHRHALGQHNDLQLMLVLSSRGLFEGHLLTISLQTLYLKVISQCPLLVIVLNLFSHRSEGWKS